MEAPSSTSERLVGFDALRAGALLLGIVYHATFAYGPGMGRWYLVEDASTDAFFTALGSALHAFRMPVFFVVSGFFAHLTLEKRGPRGFWRDRLRRLVLPLLLAAPLLVAFDAASRHWASAHGLLHPAYAGGTDWLWRPLYLWFLEYLVLFSALAGAFATSWAERLSRWLGEQLVRWPLLLLLGVPLTALTTLKLGEPTPAFSYLPQPSAVATYGVFFGVGWALHTVKAQLSSLQHWQLGGLVGLALAAWVYSRPLQWQPEGVWLGALATWCTVLGALGVAARPWERSPVVRRAVEASYWVYLTHYPAVVTLHLALTQVEAPAWAKYVTVTLATGLVSFGSRAVFRSLRRSPKAETVRVDPHVH